jgi:hypothetical protein
LAALRGKDLGVCAACGQPVFFEQNFTGLHGRVAHVRCPITARALEHAAVALAAFDAADRL